MKRIILIVLGVLLVGFLAVGFYIDSIVESQIEERASDALGVETRVGSTDVGILSGGLDLGNLRIANPEGFDAEHILTVGQVSLRVSLGTLMSETITAPSLLIRNLQLYVENKDGRTNIAELRDNLRRARGGSGGGSGKKFVIEEVVIEGIRAQVSLPAVDPVTLEIPEIRLKDVGKGGGSPVGQDQLIQLIVDEIARQAMSKASGPGLIDQIKKRLPIGRG